MRRVGRRLPAVPPWLAGAALGALAAVASAALATGSPAAAPPAYGICVACHTRDLLGAVLAGALGLPLDLPPAMGPGWVLTVPGILVGAFLAARAAGEYRLGPARHPLWSATLGAATMVCSLLALGCTARLLLRAAWGDPLAGWALLGTAAGVGTGTVLMRLTARR